MRKPIAVTINDIHYDRKDLELAQASMDAAVSLATTLRVPLIIAGDLNDTKRSWDSECIDSVTLSLSRTKLPTKIIPGNHDKEHEKSKRHSLNFLNNVWADVISVPTFDQKLGLYFIPYQNDKDVFLTILSQIPKGSRIVMHQGVQGAYMGEYAVDRTSIPASAFEGYVVYSGHYHRRQQVGSVLYLGNPYTKSYIEAHDGPKGLNVLYDDGSAELHPLDLRRHVILECRFDELNTLEKQRPQDLVWLKVSGPASELRKLNRVKIGQEILGIANFKFDKIADKAQVEKRVTRETSPVKMMDSVIANSEETKDQKKYLKNLWREVMDEAN